MRTPGFSNWFDYREGLIVCEWHRSLLSPLLPVSPVYTFPLQVILGKSINGSFLFLFLPYSSESRSLSLVEVQCRYRSEFDISKPLMVFLLSGFSLECSCLGLTRPKWSRDKKEGPDREEIVR